MNIFGYCGLIEEIKVGFLFLQYEMAVLEVELGHRIGSFSKAVLCFYHELVKVFLNFVSR
jgi:hypothetical protein